MQKRKLGNNNLFSALGLRCMGGARSELTQEDLREIDTADIASIRT